MPVNAWGGDFLISKPTNARTVELCAKIIIPACLALRINAVMVEFPGRRALLASNAGKTDAELCRVDNISQQYPNLIKVEPALQQLTIVALSITALPPIKTMADLKAYKRGSQKGMKAAENYFRQGFNHYVTSGQITAKTFSFTGHRSFNLNSIIIFTSAISICLQH
ncbi:hypothetical protein [Thalassomonas actiniarum]|uniref:Uncharacterized protein n=1 Tax=Thalassomonas actiniarum TaxID=485447 RepID=A0AAE9YUP1_9GAMM|nr:hypothetical protein [Thalassomonas actiniarum]WDE01570.1 hypothetical protein SG35_013675 [Thalassomonas actiniarum]